ncbi:MAG: HNH endonuclease [Lachnospiraceae bacterium]|nr:HNH endonuclease [Lachnospiraceae bacterium]
MEIDRGKLDYMIGQFIEFIRHEDQREDGYISFSESSGFLGREENYKTQAAVNASRDLCADKWTTKWIGTGKIAQYAILAMNNVDNNLVHRNQKLKFKNCLDSTHPDYKSDGEEVLYQIYRGNDDAEAFKNAVGVFGAKYDTIAYLFFVKNKERYLPIRSSMFDASFQKLGLAFKTSRRCNWDNYTEFIKLVAEVRDEMKEIIPLRYPEEVRLIDAHSFLWILQQSRFDEWLNKQGSVSELRMERTGVTQKRTVQTQIYTRSEEVKRETRLRAKGRCQLCGEEAPFLNTEGEPYLEVHHILWLSRGGADSIENTAALCPNCHARMHILDDQQDVEKLESVV